MTRVFAVLVMAVGMPGLKSTELRKSFYSLYSISSNPLRFKIEVLNKAYKRLQYIPFLLVKENLEHFMSVLRYRLPLFSGKRPNQCDANL